MNDTPAGYAAWERRGSIRRVRDRDVFVVDEGAGDRTVLLLHGFPSSSHDWATVTDQLSSTRRVVTFDFIGYGSSEKPFDHRVTILEQADLAEALLAQLGVTSVVLVGHDYGQTVAAELMARQNAASLSFAISSAVITNGSTLVDLQELSDGQKFLLALPDEPLAESLDLDGLRPGLRATFPPGAEVESALDDMIHSIRIADGDRLLPVLFRYIDERRELEARFADGIVTCEVPVHIAWGSLDPIALVGIAHEFLARRSTAGLATELTVWDDVGHWPSIDVPDRMAAVIASMP